MAEAPSPDTDRRFLEQAGHMLRQSVDELDAATRSRLNRARQAALAEFDRGSAVPAWLPGSRWYAGAALATVAVMAVGILIARVPVQAPESIAQVEHAAEVDVVLADESLEMLDDLDFYDWLGAEDVLPAADVAPSRAG